jgi:Alpha-glutamyl/putrescinyl thymine pyrophosphorylase clade 2/Glutamine amidotransferase domain
MCGIIGYQFIDGKRPVDTSICRAFLEQLLIQSKIRGLHATGVAYLEDAKLAVCKAPLPADKFLQQPEWDCFIAEMPSEAIFHCRYSTSGTWEDSRNNQPLGLSRAALVLNGLVSMATREEYEEAYRVRTSTSNDTELILRFVNGFMKNGDGAEDAIDHALVEIHRVEPPIFACGILTGDGELLCVRDHVRPLYRFWVPALNMVGFCSTRDIFERAVQYSHLDRAESKLFGCTPYRIYNLTTGAQRAMSFSHPEAPKLCLPQHWSFASDQTVLQNQHAKADLGTEPALNPAIDFRIDRREGFIQYYAAMLAAQDVDPSFPTMSEIFSRYELSLEQRYLVSFYYAVFYENATVFLMLQEFPELEKIDVGRLKRWHDKNWKLLQYQVDRKWNKGHLVEQVVSYKDLIGSQTQHQFFSRLIVPGDPVTSFNNCWRELNKVHRMGRHSVYAWTETLIRCVGLPIQCPSFYMSEAESSRNGLCYAIGRDDLVTKHDKKLTDGERISDAEIAYLDAQLEDLMSEIRNRYPSIPVDYMLAETVCCAYKGLHRSRRYLGYYLDRMAMEIRRGESKMEAISRGVDWETLWQIRMDILPHEYLGELQNPPWYDIRDELCSVFLDTGKLINLEQLMRCGLIGTQHAIR